MDALLFTVVEEFGGGVVGVQLDLVDGGDGLAGRVCEELFEVLDGEVRDADVCGLEELAMLSFKVG